MRSTRKEKAMSELSFIILMSAIFMAALAQPVAAGKPNRLSLPEAVSGAWNLLLRTWME
jgi:hypothetical protein